MQLFGIIKLLNFVLSPGGSKTIFQQQSTLIWSSYEGRNGTTWTVILFGSSVHWTALKPEVDLRHWMQYWQPSKSAPKVSCYIYMHELIFHVLEIDRLLIWWRSRLRSLRQTIAQKNNIINYINYEPANYQNSGGRRCWPGEWSTS